MSTNTQMIMPYTNWRADERFYPFIRQMIFKPTTNTTTIFGLEAEGHEGFYTILLQSIMKDGIGTAESEVVVTIQTWLHPLLAGADIIPASRKRVLERFVYQHSDKDGYKNALEKAKQFVFSYDNYEFD